MSNTLNSSLTTKLLVQETIASAAAVCPPLRSAFTLLEVKPPGPGRTLEIASCSAKAATLVNPTDWETGAATVAAVEVTMNLYSKVYGLSADDIQKGITLQSIAKRATEDFITDLIGVIVTPLTVANFGAAVVSVASDAFGQSDLETFQASVNSWRKVCLMHTSYASKIRIVWVPITNPAIFEVSPWTSAGPNVVGAVLDPSALIVATGLPDSSAIARSPMTVERFVLPGLEIPAELCTWVLPGTRQLRAALSVFLGASPGVTSACKLLKAA